MRGGTISLGVTLGAIALGPFLLFACMPEIPQYPASLRAAASASASGAWPPSSAVGYTYCQDFEKDTRFASDAFNFGAWATAVGAVGALGTGTLIVTNDSTGNTWETKRGSILALAAVPLGILSYYWFTRSDSASAAAAAAAQGMTAHTDPEAYDNCVGAAAVWDSSIQAANSVAVAGLQNQLGKAASTSSAAASALNAAAASASAAAASLNAAASAYASAPGKPLPGH